MAETQPAPTPPGGFLHTWWRTVRYDLALLHHHPRFVLALLAVLLVPMLYAGIYLSSMWDPAAHTRSLRVALVNEDQGVEFQGRRVHLGDELMRALAQDPTFAYQHVDGADAARQAVRRGDYSFALLVPADFSRVAVPGEQAGGGRLTVYLSEGNNYVGASFARRFAPELARKLNHTLNEQRWNAVLASASGASHDVAQLRAGVLQLLDGARQLASASSQARQGAQQLAGGSRQLRDGSAQLADGLKQLDAGAAQLTGGMKQAGGALRTMQSKLPAAADLQALNDGARQLADGQKELGAGLRQLQHGAAQLRDGAQTLGHESRKLPIGAGKVEDAARQLEGGASQLHGGLGQASSASDRLGSGASQLAGGVGQLTAGMTQLGGGIGQLAGALPPDARLDEFASATGRAGRGAGTLADGARQLDGGAAQLAAGLAKLADGAQHLSDALALLQAKLPETVATLPGSAAGLAESIQPLIDVAAPVANQGSGYTPNFAPLALWVGATLCTFLFAWRRLPAPLLGQSRLAIVLGKLFMPGMVLLLQALILIAMLLAGLHVEVVSVPRFVATLLLTASAFLALLFALVLVLGDAGRLVALVLLVLQLASAGATLPVELTTPFFQAMHPFMPLSWVVRALRIAMFGAFDGQWLASVAVVLAIDAACILTAAALGRYRVVAPQDYQPQIEVD